MGKVRDMSGPTRILLGLLAGLVLGLLAKFLAGGHPWLELAIRNAIEPLGRMWLASLIMVVIPLILSTLALGAVSYTHLDVYKRQPTNMKPKKRPSFCLSTRLRSKRAITRAG